MDIHYNIKLYLVHLSTYRIYGIELTNVIDDSCITDYISRQT